MKLKNLICGDYKPYNHLEKEVTDYMKLLPQIWAKFPYGTRLPKTRKWLVEATDSDLWEFSHVVIGYPLLVTGYHSVMVQSLLVFSQFSHYSSTQTFKTHEETRNHTLMQMTMAS